MNNLDIDMRLKQLSYSSRQLLNSCPRKYQLRKLDASFQIEEDMNQKITFEFGKLVGLGIQLVFMDHSREDIFLTCFSYYPLDINFVSSKHKKSFYLALIAIDKFISMRQAGFLQDLVILSYNGQPAAELSFLIDFNEGFAERGFLDLVLEHKITGEVFCVEIKTDSSKAPIHEAKYQNSGQALGYSVLLDYIRPGLVSYNVLYLIYLTEKFEYQVFQFTKTIVQKAEWLGSIMIDIDKIKLYERAKLWPKNGASCFAYFQPCKYFNMCQLSDQLLIKPLTEARKQEILKDNEETYTIKASLNELLDTQLERKEIKELK